MKAFLFQRKIKTYKEFFDEDYCGGNDMAWLLVTCLSDSGGPDVNNIVYIKLIYKLKSAECL